MIFHPVGALFTSSCMYAAFLHKEHLCPKIVIERLQKVCHPHAQRTIRLQEALSQAARHPDTASSVSCAVSRHPHPCFFSSCHELPSRWEAVSAIWSR